MIATFSANRGDATTKDHSWTDHDRKIAAFRIVSRILVVYQHLMRELRTEPFSSRERRINVGQPLLRLASLPKLSRDEGLRIAADKNMATLRQSHSESL